MFWTSGHPSQAQVKRSSPSHLPPFSYITMFWWKEQSAGSSNDELRYQTVASSLKPPASERQKLSGLKGDTPGAAFCDWTACFSAGD